MRSQLQVDGKDMKIMKIVNDKIIEEVQAWEDGTHGAAALGSPPGIALHGTPALGTVGTIGAETAAPQGIALHRRPAR